MTPLHVELRESRERKGLTLEALHTSTRIGLDFLAAIERGDFDFLPKTYIRLFLRSYATHVGMDPQYVLDRYEELVRPVPEETQGPPVEEQRRPLSWGVVVALAAGLVVLGWSGVLLFKGQMGGAPEGPRGFASSPASSVEGTSERERPAAAEGSLQVAAPDTASSPATAGQQGRDTSPVLSTPIAGLGQDSALVLEGVGVEETWLDVSADGQRVFRGTVKPGDAQRWTARERFYVVAGRSGGVQFSLQGRPIPRVGSGPPEVLRMSVTRAGVVVEQRPREVRPAEARGDTAPQRRDTAADTGSGGQ
jgi:cytoskeletal protein RodZ